MFITLSITDVANFTYKNKFQFTKNFFEFELQR